MIEGLITDLAFILLLGAVVTLVFKRIRQPVVLGYIVAGFLASPNFTWLPSVTTAENIDFWAQIGIVVLLFALGLEFSFKKLAGTGASAVVTALVIVTGMMCVGTVIGHFMGFTPVNSLFLGGMLSMSSTTIILKAFTDMGLRQQRFASIVLAVLIVEDLFAVLMMVILSSIATANAVAGTQLLGSVARLVFFLVLWFVVGVYLLPTLLNICRRWLNAETLLVVSMGLCLASAVGAVACGFSLALGAFVMGSILGGTSYAERIEHVVTPVKDLFGAVFFISVGMMVQPAIIGQYWPQILLLSASVIVGMIVFGTAGMLLTGQSLRTAVQAGFALTQIGEFAFIIATLGMSLGVLDASIYPIVVAVSVLTTFTTPYFIRMSGPAASWLDGHLPARLRLVIERYQRRATDQAAGGGMWKLALRHHMVRILIYAVVLSAISLAVKIYADPYVERMLPSWGQWLMLGVTLTVMAPFLAAMTLPLLRVIAGRGDAAEGIAGIVMAVVSTAVALGFVVYAVSHAISAGWALTVGAAAVMLLVMVLSRKVRRQMAGIESRFVSNLNERDLRRSGHWGDALVADQHLAYMQVGYGCEFGGERLKNAGLRTRYGVNVVAIVRGGQTILVPGGERRILPGDVLGVVGTDAQIAELLPAVERAPQTSGADNADISDVKIVNMRLTDTSPLAGKTPRTSRLIDDYDALLLAVQRGDHYLKTQPDLVFAAGDILWLVGPSQRLSDLK